MRYKGKKVFVTGAGGFIGSHLVQALIKEGALVTALVEYNSLGSWHFLEELDFKEKEKCIIELGDIRDPFHMSQLIEDKDIVFHLAALIGIPYSYFSPKSYVDTNVQGTLNILEACRKAKIDRLIHTSTSETYGSAIYTPIDENHPLQGQSPYSASKISADKLVESYFMSFDLPVITLRPFNTYGPRQSARAVIPSLVSQLLSDKGSIKVGSLSPKRDMTFVFDTVEGFILAGLSPKNSIGESINLGVGKTSSIGDILQILMTLTKKSPEIEVEEKRIRPEKSEVMTLLSDNSKALELLDWKPTYSLELGLEQVIYYISEHMGDYKTEIYNI